MLNPDFKQKLFLSVPPLISPAQTELSVIQGFQALLPCAAQGSPEPRISWEKNGTPVPNLPGKYTVLRSGELIIERAEVSLLFLFLLFLCSEVHRQPLNHFWFLSAACRCWSVYLHGGQCCRICQTRQPPVHQHEARLQGAAGRCDLEQRSESGFILPRSGNTVTCHFLDCQQQSSQR